MKTYGCEVSFTAHTTHSPRSCFWTKVAELKVIMITTDPLSRRTAPTLAISHYNATWAATQQRHFLEVERGGPQRSEGGHPCSPYWHRRIVPPLSHRRLSPPVCYFSSRRGDSEQSRLTQSATLAVIAIRPTDCNRNSTSQTKSRIGAGRPAVRFNLSSSRRCAQPLGAPPLAARFTLGDASLLLRLTVFPSALTSASQSARDGPQR